MFIPLTKKISWRNPPYITIAIIAMNVIVFFGIQGKDNYYEAQAHSFYFESALDRIEFPLYIDFLKGHRPETYREVDHVDMDADPEDSMRLYSHLIFDKAFLDRLANGELGSEDIFEKEKHRSLRQEYQEKLDRVVSLQYGFRPAAPRMETWLTTMFLHGSVGHLVGNMVFLWLIGCLIEYGCRRWLFGVIYGLGGLAATGLFWLLNSDSLVPLVGASGAISGIMGAFAVFYGLKRVRVFLNLGFYFNYLKFPAIVMLPFWVGNELFQMVTNEGSNVAYAAHLGGLLGGSSLAFALGRIPNLLDWEGFEEAQEDPVQPMIEKALGHMGKLEFTQARALLEQAQEMQPENEVILRHLYTIDRQNPDENKFHDTSRKLLAYLCRRPEAYSQAHEVYREYIKVARPAKLGTDMYLLLCRIFCEIGKLNDAQRLVSVLVKKRPDLNEIPSLLLKLAESYGQNGDRKSSRACLISVFKKYPMSSEAQIAKQQLEFELKN